ncbi:DUF421 domain-containing protein [Massilia sp. CCM 9210]|uniref:DUF421 domain-containing protein n=1 Tax=Massilia scottii TaxID=3057166 RepID=UPI002796BCD8|nr:YetF domain-containing protein [Massilia sp. CCM 9210]MDQ1815548.1 DUF421 domain-containing protein [Massilia sp. CCM 9210]
MYFDSWESIARMAIAGSAAYVCAIFMLRISGSRTLSKMSAFDLVITIAFGSTLSAILVNSSVSLATGVAALALLVALQYVIAALASRSRRFSALITSRPVLLAWDGRTLDVAMRRERVTGDDMLAALRQHGVAGFEQVQAIVLEADGSLSVVKKPAFGSAPALREIAPPG